MKNKLIISGVLILQIAVSGVAWAQSANVVTKQYDDGGIYEGTFKNGLQDGKGTYSLPNGYKYTGDWVEGEIRGQGVAVFPNCLLYTSPSPRDMRRSRMPSSA